MDIVTLRKIAGREEIDYQLIMSALSKEYTCPREKISTWLRLGDLIRVKKGLYIFGKRVALQLYSKELLANLVYGPSAVSLTYALNYYGIIPERVNTVTCITNNRARHFLTPIGEFRYFYLHPRKYAVEIVLDSTSPTQHFLIATPEKALADQIHIVDKNYQFNNTDDIEKYLLHDLRVDEQLLDKLRYKKFCELASWYKDKRFALLASYMKSRRSNHA